MSLEFVDRPATYYFLGDSHTMIFEGLLFAERESGRRVMTRADHHRYFLAHEFTGWGGKLEARACASLTVNNFFGPVPEEHAVPAYGRMTTTQCGLKVEEGLGVGFARTKPLVIMCGEIDSRNILSQFKETTDVELGFESPAIAALPEFEATRTIAAHELTAFLEREFQPLYDGLATLKSSGIQRLFLHSIPPPTLDDDDAKRVLTFRRAARVRYKVALAINRLYARYCEQLGIGFIDIWDAVTDASGLLDRAYYLDGLHLNKGAAFLTVNRVHAAISGTATPATVAIHPLLDEVGEGV